MRKNIAAIKAPGKGLAHAIRPSGSDSRSRGGEADAVDSFNCGIGGAMTLYWYKVHCPATGEAPPPEHGQIEPHAVTDTPPNDETPTLPHLHCGVGGFMGIYRYALYCPAHNSRGDATLVEAS